MPTTGTVYGIVTDNHGIIVAAKYLWNPIKFYGGFEYIWQNNPTNPLGVGGSDEGGYQLSGVEDNNLDSQKQVNIWWTGAKYAVDKKTDITFAWYQQRQNTFRVPPTCMAGNYRASCAGTLNEGSLYADHHFTPRFDMFAGLAYSWVSGGLGIAIPHGPGVPVLLQQQHGSGHRRPVRVLMDYAGGLGRSPPCYAVREVCSPLARPSEHSHCICWPPLIETLAPVRNAASSEHR